MIAVVLLLVGTNLFTYATTRYSTTRLVLIRAEQNMESALRDMRVYEDLQQTKNIQFNNAIRMAGGMYYWWNHALIWWGAGLTGMIVGVFLLARRPSESEAQQT